MGDSTHQQRFVSSTNRGRVDTDPEYFAAAVAAMRHRWRTEDMPEMDQAADILMRRFMRSRHPADRDEWREAECEILHCLIALGDVDPDGRDSRVQVTEMMRKRASEAGRRIPTPIKLDTPSRAV